MNRDKHYKNIVFILEQCRTEDENLKRAYLSVLESCIEYLKRYRGRITDNGYNINGFNITKSYSIDCVLMHSESFSICFSDFTLYKNIRLK